MTKRGPMTRGEIARELAQRLRERAALEKDHARSPESGEFLRLVLARLEEIAEAPASVDPAEAAAMLRRVLEAVERGELTGPATMIARMEGAVSALESLDRAG